MMSSLQSVEKFFEGAAFATSHATAVSYEKELQKGDSFFLGSICRCWQIYNMNEFSQYLMQQRIPLLFLGKLFSPVAQGSACLLLLFGGARTTKIWRNFAAKARQALPPSCMPTMIERGCYSAVEAIDHYSTFYLHHIVTGWFVLQSLLTVVSTGSLLGWGSLATLLYYSSERYLPQKMTWYIDRAFVCSASLLENLILPNLLFLRLLIRLNLCLWLAGSSLPKGIYRSYFIYPLSWMSCRAISLLQGQQPAVFSLQEIETPPPPLTNKKSQMIRTILKAQDPFKHCLLEPSTLLLSTKNKKETGKFDFNQLMEHFDAIPAQFFEEEDRVIPLFIGNDRFNSWCREKGINMTDASGATLSVQDKLQRLISISEEHFSQGKYIQWWMKKQLLNLQEETGLILATFDKGNREKEVNEGMAKFLELLQTKSSEDRMRYMLRLAGQTAGLCRAGQINGIKILVEEMCSLEPQRLVTDQEVEFENLKEFIEKTLKTITRELMKQRFFLNILKNDNIHLYEMTDDFNFFWISSEKEFLDISELFEEFICRPLHFSELYKFYMLHVKECLLHLIQDQKIASGCCRYITNMINNKYSLKEEEKENFRDMLLKADEKRMENTIFNSYLPFLTWMLVDMQFFRYNEKVTEHSF